MLSRRAHRSTGRALDGPACVLGIDFGIDSVRSIVVDATAEHLEDLAAMLGVEYLRIGHGTDLTALKRELRWNDVAFRLAR